MDCIWSICSKDENKKSKGKKTCSEVQLSLETNVGKTDRRAVVSETELPRPYVMGGGGCGGSIKIRCWQI
jgi:hypothetical protein